MMLSAALDGQTFSVKAYANRLPSAVDLKFVGAILQGVQTV